MTWPAAAAAAAAVFGPPKPFLLLGLPKKQKQKLHKNC